MTEAKEYSQRRWIRSPMRVLVLLVVGAAILLLAVFAVSLQDPSFFGNLLLPWKPYDFVEVTALVSSPHAANPFTDADISGTFEGGGKRWQVEGFSDAEDGSVYRVRFMPPAAGDYTYSVEYRQGWSSTNLRERSM